MVGDIIFYFILVIPVCNGEIMGYPFVVYDKADIKEESLCIEFIIEDNNLISFSEFIN